MDGKTLLFVLIGICLLVIFLFIFQKPLKLVFKLLINSALGILAFIGMNFILSPLGMAVGVNLLTVLIVGILGIPGFLCLYLSQLLL